MPVEQARAGGLACTWCGLPWKVDGKQLVIGTEELAERIAAFLAAGGEAVYVGALKRVVYIPPDRVVAAPGRARIEDCPDCDHDVSSGGKPCRECAGTGWQVWKACPRCGDSAMWRYMDGRTRMHCQACQASWGRDYPGWLAQRLPARLLTARLPVCTPGREGSGIGH